MNIANLISTIGAEIAALEKARSVLVDDSDLSETSSARKRGRKRPGLSAEARKRIAGTQRKGWVALKKAASKAA